MAQEAMTGMERSPPYILKGSPGRHQVMLDSVGIGRLPVPISLMLLSSLVSRSSGSDEDSKFRGRGWYELRVKYSLLATFIPMAQMIVQYFIVYSRGYRNSAADSRLKNSKYACFSISILNNNLDKCFFS